MSVAQVNDAQRQWGSAQVHISLGKLFLVLWLGVSSIVAVSPRLQPRNLGQFLVVLAPPSSPFVAAASGDYDVAAIFGAITSVVVLAWALAAHRPQSRPWRIAARIVILAYWFILLFAFGLSA